MSPDVDAATWARLLEPIAVYLRPSGGVVAADRDGGERVLIIEETDKTAAERHIEALGGTVAEQNPEYPSDDAVFSVVFLNSLPDFYKNKPLGIVARDVKRQDIPKYEFPESRLKPVAPDRVTLGDFDTEQRGGK